MATVPAKKARFGVIQTYILTAALSAGFAFAGGWKINDWRHDATQKQAVEATAVAQRELHALEQKRSSGVIAAQNLARTREIVLRRDAAASRDALDGLREQSAVALQNARSGHDACTVTALAAAVIQSQCATELQTLAGTADRWVSEVILLQDSWPR